MTKIYTRHVKPASPHETRQLQETEKHINELWKKLGEVEAAASSASTSTSTSVTNVYGGSTSTTSTTVVSGSDIPENLVYKDDQGNALTNGVRVAGATSGEVSIRAQDGSTGGYTLPAYPGSVGQVMTLGYDNEMSWEGVSNLSQLGRVQALTGFFAEDKSDIPTLSANQLLLTFERDITKEPPSHIYIQLKTALPFPTRDLIHSGEGLLPTSFGYKFYLPSNIDLSGADGQTLVVTSPDGTSTARYIVSVIGGYVDYEGTQWREVWVDKAIYRMAGRMTFEVWDSGWANDGTAYSALLPVTDADLNPGTLEYEVTATININFTGYVRGYLLNQYSISDLYAGVVAKDSLGVDDAIVTLVAVAAPPEDFAVPSAPTGLTATVENRTFIRVRWDAPVTNVATLSGYKIRVSKTQPSGTFPGGPYTMADYTEYAVGAGTQTTLVPTETAGRYYLGVIAVNGVGDGPLMTVEVGG